MTRASTATPEMERIVNAVIQWLLIRRKENPDEDLITNIQADADHSSLLSRLLDGKEPLKHAPPLSYSYPWYSLIEEGEAEVSDTHVFHHEASNLGLFGGEYFVIGQSPWFVTRKDGETWFLRHPKGWLAHLQTVPDMVTGWSKDGEVRGSGYKLSIDGYDGKKLDLREGQGEED